MGRSVIKQQQQYNFEVDGIEDNTRNDFNILVNWRWHQENVNKDWKIWHWYHTGAHPIIQPEQVQSRI